MKIGAHAVHFIDKSNTRNAVFVGLTATTVSVCGCTPATAQKTATAPSKTRKERSTSMVKSTCPGGVNDVDAML